MSNDDWMKHTGGSGGGMPPESWTLACGFRSFTGTLVELGPIGPNAIKVAISCTQSLEFERTVNTAIIGLYPIEVDTTGTEPVQVYQTGALVRVNIMPPNDEALSVEAIFSDVWASN